METKFKDIAHLYKGCQFYLKKPILRPLSDISEMEIIHLFSIAYRNIFNHSCDFEQRQFLVENDDAVGLIGIDRLDNSRIGFTVETDRGVEISIAESKLNVNQFEMTKELLRNHFDLFGLIKSDQAIAKPIV